MNLVMFDVDGTLVDSTGFDETCFLKAAELMFGIRISPDWDSYKYATDIGILHEVIERYMIPGDTDTLVQKFRETFLELISGYISDNPCCIREIAGAAGFLKNLSERDDCIVAIATGGWGETAKLKLRAAGVDISGCVFASSSDHYSREGIMRAAESQASRGVQVASRIYFGDAPWDRKACENLNYRFILVGNRFKYKETIQDYSDRNAVFEMLGM